MILLLLAAEAAAPAPAGPIDHLHTVVVQAIRNCPASEDGTITVCARDRGFAERYRLQRLDPSYADAGHVHVGPLSGEGAVAANGGCSNIGASATGCSLQEENAWGDWKRGEKAKGRPFPW